MIIQMNILPLGLKKFFADMNCFLLNVKNLKSFAKVYDPELKIIVGIIIVRYLFILAICHFQHINQP